MSVYKRPGAETYSYDFELGGRRFTGNTGATDKREARKEQERVRAEEKSNAKKAKASANGPMMFGDAAARYMTEVGSLHVNWQATLSDLEWLEREIGKTTLLRSITDNVIAKLVVKRRNEFRRVGNKDTPKRKVGPATVNRTMTEPLRKIMTRARRVWKEAVEEINWAEHMLAEPKERVREASTGEESRIMSKLSRGYDLAVHFAFLTGCRLMEVAGLRKTDVDFFNRQFTVIGKGGKVRVIPMTRAVYNLLWSLKDTPTSSVFTYIAARSDARKGLVKGRHYPITKAGLRTAMKRKTAAAGVENFRFHDTRHTLATRVLRKSNTKVVKELLGHSSITTTDRYAHAMKEDVRAALEAASPALNPATDDENDAKMLEQNGKTT